MDRKDGDRDMKREALQGAEKYTKTRQWKKRWYRVMTCLACVVVFCTVYALILPAVTQENLNTSLSEGAQVPDETDDNPSNTAVNENTFVPPEKNIYPIDAFNTYEGTPNVILLSPKLDTLKDDYKKNHSISIENFFNVDGVDNFDYVNWIAYFIQVRVGRFQVIRTQYPSDKPFYMYNCNQEAYIILVKKSYMDEHNLYFPKAGLETEYEREEVDGVGDTVNINWLGNNPHIVQNSSGNPLTYITFSPKDNTATAGEREDDLAAIADSAIKFQLFDYIEKINRPDGIDNDWRPITPYFQFRGITGNYNEELDTGLPDSTYDAEAFTVNHATVERKLKDNYPVLDPNRNALGDQKESVVTVEKLPMADRSLKYLFSPGDHAVTAYNPTNTILQKNGTHYYYNSADNAVDYDVDNQMFRIRNYVERNGTTSTCGTQRQYYDFLPFDYTGGQVIGTYRADGGAYNLESADVNYWFGMRMDVDFYQSKDGKLNGEDMVFNFTGDDDIWVFIDDVLVLDLGGTHGAVTGTINFATGVIEQYLNWNGTVGTVNVTSFPTTIQACYDAANTAPNGGWNGNIFADYTKHKLSFFYLERGCSVATCAIDFNLPTLPEKSLKVTKTLQASDEADADKVNHLKNTMEYKFRVVKADEYGNPTNELLIKEGDSYTVSGAGVDNETRTVGENGYFTLKAEQTAEFTNMLNHFNINDNVKKYVVQEVLPTDQTGQYSGVYYNIIGSGTEVICIQSNIGDSTAYNSPTLEVDVANLVNYINKVDTTKLSTLAIAKTNVGTPLYDREYYYMKVQLGPNADSLMPIPVGTTYDVNGKSKTVTTAGIIQLKVSETAEIKLLSGTCYSVVEVADENGTPLTDSEGYTPTYSENHEGTVTVVGDTVNITVTNTFQTGNLELTKNVNHTSGGSTDGEFTFELKFKAGGSWTDKNYTANYTRNSGSTHAGDTLSFKKQGDYEVATVKLYHGEKVTIENLPATAIVEISETNTDGYSIGWIVKGTAVYTKTVNVPINSNSTASVVCTNTTGYELPGTGGVGTMPYIAVGFLLLTGAAFLLLYVHSRKGDG